MHGKFSGGRMFRLHHLIIPSIQRLPHPICSMHTLHGQKKNFRGGHDHILERLVVGYTSFVCVCAYITVQINAPIRAFTYVQAGALRGGGDKNLCNNALLR